MTVLLARMPALVFVLTAQASANSEPLDGPRHLRWLPSCRPDRLALSLSSQARSRSATSSRSRAPQAQACSCSASCPCTMRCAPCPLCRVYMPRRGGPFRCAILSGRELPRPLPSVVSFFDGRHTLKTQNSQNVEITTSTKRRPRQSVQRAGHMTRRLQQIEATATAVLYRAATSRLLPRSGMMWFSLARDRRRRGLTARRRPPPYHRPHPPSSHQVRRAACCARWLLPEAVTHADVV